MTDHGILTLTDAGNLADIINAPVGPNCRVARLIDGSVITGTARNIGDERGYVAHGTDVRNQFLRVTSDMGFEYFWPVSELMTEIHNTFVTNYHT